MHHPGDESNPQWTEGGHRGCAQPTQKPVSLLQAGSEALPQTRFRAERSTISRSHGWGPRAAPELEEVSTDQGNLSNEKDFFTGAQCLERPPSPQQSQDKA